MAPCGFRTPQRPDGTVDPTPFFKALETACIAIFSVEYLCRLGCVSALPLAPPEGYPEGGDTPWAGPRTALPLWLVKVRRWALRPINLVDLVAIAPYYIEEAMGGGSEGSELAVLRALRLVRVFRIFKLGKYSQVRLSSTALLARDLLTYLLTYLLTSAFFWSST